MCLRATTSVHNYMEKDAAGHGKKEKVLNALAASSGLSESLHR